MKKNKKALKPIDQPVFGYWQALYRSFYSSRLYVDVGKRWRGFGFLYLLLMITVLTIPISIKSIYYFNYFYNLQLIEPLEKMPILYIQNGEITSDKKMPYFIKGRKGEVLAIIDTSGKITSMVPTYPDLTILITKNKIFMRTPTPPLTYTLGSNNSAGPVEVQELDPTMNQVFDPKEWIKTSKINMIKYISFGVAPLIIIAFFYSMLFVFMPVLAFLGQLFSQVFFGFKIGFRQACRLIMVSSTPMITLLVILLTFDLIFTGSGIVLIAFISFYFSYALLFLKRESQQVVKT